MSVQQVPATFMGKDSQDFEQPKEGSKQRWYAKLGYLLAFVLFVDLVALGPIAYQKGRPVIAHYIEEKCSENNLMGGEILCSLLSKNAQIGDIVDDSLWSARAMNDTNSSNPSSDSSSSGNSSSGNSSSGSGNSASEVSPIGNFSGNLTALTTLLNTSGAEVSCASIGCTSDSQAYCSSLGCSSSDLAITGTTLCSPIVANNPQITLCDSSGFSVGGSLVVISGGVTYSFTITNIGESTGRRLLSKRRLADTATVSPNPPANVPAGSPAVTVGATATTTTCDKDAWWPHWAYWLLFVGLGLCLAALAAIAAMACMMGKKAPKKKAVKPPPTPPPQTTVTTTAVPMTYAQPATTAVPMMYTQPYQMPTTTAMAAPSFTTMAQPGYMMPY